MNLTPLQMNQLIEQAAAVRDRAWAPYSKFAVGAAVLVDGGHVFVGCNVENASYGLSMCAERNAIAQAVAAGHRELIAVAVVAKPLATPCGACRQVLAEFNASMPIICADAAKLADLRTFRLDELLPHRFSGDDLRQD